MQIKHVKIHRFRGIKQMEWSVKGRMVCLIGAGDSAKTTILDAIEAALSPRWMLSLSDSDFYQGETTHPIEVIVTVSDLPAELLLDDRFGLHLSGWHTRGCLRAEPDDECEKVLRVRLRVDATLEPVWSVIRQDDDVGVRISHKDRARLGVARLGAGFERDLSWGRGSALSRLTDGSNAIREILPTVSRAIRDAASAVEGSDLSKVANEAWMAASRLGAYVDGPYAPMLDPLSVNVGSGAVTLHEDGIPVRYRGLGTRRLAALAVERMIVPDGAIVLIDEVENGLEPHRIRRLLQALKADMVHAGAGQLIMTSHSPVVVVELTTDDLGVVLRSCEETRVLDVPPDLQRTIRAAPEAVLSRKVIVSEGKTEVGLLRACDHAWQANHDGQSLGVLGISVVSGEGSSTAGHALNLAKLGFRVLFFADSDRDPVPSVNELRQFGIEVVQWRDKVAIEERICNDLLLKDLQEVLNLAIRSRDAASVLNAVASRLNCSNLSTEMISDWQQADADVRRAIGQAAKATSNSWFKRIDLGELLGVLVLRALPTIPETDLAAKLATIERWVHAP